MGKAPLLFAASCLTSSPTGHTHLPTLSPPLRGVWGDVPCLALLGSWHHRADIISLLFSSVFPPLSSFSLPSISSQEKRDTHMTL